ncbi:NAD(P)/FAD-dependent oxidoreductase [Herbiconiux liukaitaii]|uniref:NAD(P)/FAD-dependent oxidoreductase n=1 Tax=Herbiconiux liukaitaii TaxID=3342799 RepID=UPI0035B8CCBA
MSIVDVLIIGAGHSGVAVATELRRAGFPGTVALANAETIEPYHRPPLSKAWLSSDAAEESGWLQPPGYFTSNSIDIVPVAVVGLEVEGRRAEFADGSAIDFGDAIIATGALAREIPLPVTPEVPFLSLRDGADARRLRDLLKPGSHLAVIGAGFIGLEVAATARRLGASVTVIEREPRVLARLASQELSDYLTSLHRGHGVDILLATDVLAIHATESGARIAVSGRESVSAGDVLADNVLVAIGAVPNDALARGAGIECAGGILVDDAGRTSALHVFAVGDVARRPLPPFAELARLESVHNANEHARIVAAGLAGVPAPAPAVPWFWSDQYDRKLQVAGLLPPESEVTVVGEVSAGAFALEHRVAGRLVCVEAVNASKEFALGRRQIAKEL